MNLSDFAQESERSPGMESANQAVPDRLQTATVCCRTTKTHRAMLVHGLIRIANSIDFYLSRL
jgi:hypothetical protein